MKKILVGLLPVALILVVVVLIRTFQFESKVEPVAPVAPIALREGSVARLAEAVQIPTISSLLKQPQGEQPFLAFQRFLASQFPLVHQHLDKETINDYSLLYTWQGKQPELKPILLLSHIDVVPVEPGTEYDWQQPAFAGVIDGGYVWGRGVWDDKSTLMASLEAVELMLAAGVQPQRTLMLAFGHDEEIGGQQGAVATAALLEGRGVEFEFVLDEGANISEGRFGVAEPVALVSVAEKGYLTLELTAAGPGGHSSVPPAMTAVGRLSRAVDKLQNQPLEAAMNAPTIAMFEALGADLPFVPRMLWANRWLFEPVIINEMVKDKLTAALVRTTTAPTMLSAGVKENVLPQSAQATVNFRLAPGDSSADVLARVQQIIDDDQVEVVIAGDIHSEPSTVATTESYGYQQISLAARQVVPDLKVVPFLLFGATDSRHYQAVSKAIYKFSAIQLAAGEDSNIHGTNERIPVAGYEGLIRFYYQLLDNAVVMASE